MLLVDFFNTDNIMLQEYNTGGTHEENPLGGIPVGIGANGKPNLVEQGETRYGDYIFSDRVTPFNKEVLQGLPVNNTNQSYASISKSITKEAKERPNDPISQRGQKILLDKLMQSQELSKKLKQQEEAKKKAMLKRKALLKLIREREADNPLFSQSILPQEQPAQAPNPQGVPQSQEELAKMLALQQAQQASQEENVFAGGGAVKVDKNRHKEIEFWRNKFRGLGDNLDQIQIHQLINEGKIQEVYNQALLEKKKTGELSNISSSATSIIDSVDRKTADSEGQFISQSDPQYLNQNDWTSWIAPVGTGIGTIGSIAGLGRGYYRDKEAGKLYKEYTKIAQENITKNGLPNDAATLQKELLNVVNEKIVDLPKWKQNRILRLVQKEMGTLPKYTRILKEIGRSIPYLGLGAALGSYIYNKWGDHKEDLKNESVMNARRINEEIRGQVNLNGERHALGGNLYSEGSWLPLLRFAPSAINGLHTFSDAIGVTNKSNYEYANRISDLAHTIGNYNYSPIGKYMQYTPFDREYHSNKLAAQANNTTANLMNTYGGNRASAQAGLLAKSLGDQIALGNLYRQAEEYNLNQRNQVLQYNNNLDMQNAQRALQINQLNQQNQQLRNQYTMQGIQAMMNEDIATSQARNTNRNLFLKDLSNIGDAIYKGQSISAMYPNVGYDPLTGKYYHRAPYSNDKNIEKKEQSSKEDPTYNSTGLNEYGPLRQTYKGNIGKYEEKYYDTLSDILWATVGVPPSYFKFYDDPNEFRRSYVPRYLTDSNLTPKELDLDKRREYTSLLDNL